jgi:hypothetical protein
LAHLVRIPPEQIAPSQDSISLSHLDTLCALSPEEFALEPPTVVRYMGRGAYLAIDGHHHAVAALVRGVRAKALALRAGEQIPRDQFPSDESFKRVLSTVRYREVLVVNFAYEVRLGTGVQCLDDLLPPGRKSTKPRTDAFTFLNPDFPWSPSYILLGG